MAKLAGFAAFFFAIEQWRRKQKRFQTIWFAAYSKYKNVGLDSYSQLTTHMIRLLIYLVGAGVAFHYWGWWGIPIGIALSWLGLTIITAFLFVSGSQIPPKELKALSLGYLVRNKDMMGRLYPGMTDQEKWSAIGKDVKMIFEMAKGAAISAGNPNAAASRLAVRLGADQLISFEKDPQRIEHLNLLEAYIEEYCYPPITQESREVMDGVNKQLGIGYHPDPKE